ncbi:efflux RND transporter periplasmic adaptor subunit [Sulfobacillus harzensis]|uniref:RND transporter n=1 Tax=Sulfobacillus harzensis TaxID=2729629 RepID=A0A7Y0LAB9_9FIRM|nr:efflux RND transporter periplasmic adaptor subunit [Sulfobacillus harzensis]NMP24774.1 RND transporter [Sulfobacillus harzensis]
MDGKVVIALGALTLFTAAWVTRPAHPVEASTTAHVTVGTETVIKDVSLAGTVQSSNQVSVSYTGTPTSVSGIPVKVGTAVASGSVLAKLANGQSLTSPLQGTVVAVNLAPGDLVPGSSSAAPASGSSSSGFSGHGFAGRSASVQSVSVGGTSETPLSITVAQVNHVSVTASVSELVVGELHPGQSVRIGVPGEPGIQYRGTIAAVSMVSSAQSGTASYPVTITFTNLSGKPIPKLGMSADLSVQVKSQTGVAVPIAAVHQQGQRDSVTLANGQQVPVQLGLIGLNHVIVTHGLSAGETILVPKKSISGQAGHTVTVEVLPSFPRGFSGRFGGGNPGGGL